MTCHICAKTNCIGECEPKPLAWKHYTKPLERRLQHLEAKEHQNSFDKHEASALRHVLGVVTQPKREWVGLTEEEMRELEKQFNAERVRTSDEEYLVIYPGDYWEWQRAIEAKLKEKNT